MTLLAAALAVGIAAPAQAVPVVNEYTEEMPDPSGPGHTGKPNKNSGNGGSQTTNGGNSGESEAQSNSYGTSTGYGTDSYSTDAGTGQTGSDGEKAKKDKSEDESEKKDRKTARADRDERSDLAAVSPSGGDDDDGMGLIFPLAILVVAGLVGGIVYFRRNRGSLAT